jgi:hypothetical protein
MLIYLSSLKINRLALAPEGAVVQYYFYGGRGEVQRIKAKKASVTIPWCLALFSEDL